MILPVGFPQRPALPLGGTLKRNIEAIHEAGGIAQVNRPNLHWSVRLDDLLPVTRPFLMETWNAFPSSNNLGGAETTGKASPSTEGVWDALLTQGKIVWGVASDNAHDYIHFDDRDAPTPGKAWIVVRAAALNPAAIAATLRKGKFYASTGIDLVSHVADANGIALVLEPLPEWKSTQKRVTRFTTRFIGANGRLLAEVTGPAPSYRFKGDDVYVRASILDSDGRRAWTQPIFLDDRRAPD